MLGTVGLTLIGLVLGLALALRAYRAFSGTTQVAEVRCRWTGPEAFDLTFAPVRDGRLGPPQTFHLRGAQWTVSGGIVKWHPWLTVCGLPSYQKLTRLSGRFATVAQETAAPPTAFALNGGDDPMWWWFYRADPWLPFVEATYGSAAFLPCDPSTVTDVLVSPSGYLLKRRPRS